MAESTVHLDGGYCIKFKTKIMEFKKAEIWEDYWCFIPSKDILFNDFEKLDYQCWCDNKKHDIKVILEIDEEDPAEIPSARQIEILDFIYQNQKSIINSIWKYYSDLMLPIYDEAVGLEDEWIAKDISDISQIFGIKKIEIPTYDYNSSYFRLELDFQYECEHGCYILFRNHTPIDFYEIGTKNDDAIDLYENGLGNSDKSKFSISINELNGKSVFGGDFFDDEEISFNLKKGAYRTYYTVNSANRIRNIIVDSDKETFTLKHILTNCTEK